jgi:hypothetical protein
MVEVHLQETMANLSVKIILLLEAEMTILDKAVANNSCHSSINIFTFYDDFEDLPDKSSKFNRRSNGSIKVAVNKTPRGRLKKIMGTIYLYLYLFISIYISI